jgi:ADP-ribose pyrophosphatase
MAERTVNSTRAYEGKLVSLRVDEVVLDEGSHTTREVVEHPGAVAILAWDGERLAAVRQWRHAVGAELLEIPAGTLNPGEKPLATAARELAEESGLAAARWEEGPRFFTAPGFCTEELRLFLATDLTDAESLADADEVIERTHMTLAEALAAIEEGTIVDAKSIAGIYWLARRIGA